MEKQKEEAMTKAYTADKRNARSRFKAAMERARIWGRNCAAALHNKHQKDSIAYLTKSDEVTKRRALVNGMTNWQRNQMLRACEGQIVKLPTEKLEFYAGMPHHKRVRRMAGL